MLETDNHTNELVAKTYNDSYSGSTKLSSLYVKNHEGDTPYDVTYTFTQAFFTTEVPVDGIEGGEGAEFTAPDAEDGEDEGDEDAEDPEKGFFHGQRFYHPKIAKNA